MRKLLICIALMASSATYAFGLVATLGGIAKDGKVAVSGKYAYLIDCCNSRSNLHVADINDPKNPQWKNTIHLKDAEADKIAADGECVYITDNRGMLHVVKIDHNDINRSTTASIGEINKPKSVTVAGDYVYVMGQQNNHAILYIIKINRNSIYGLRIVKTIYFETRYVNEVVADNDYAYVTGGHGDNLYIVKIDHDNIGNSSIIKTIEIGCLISTHKVAVAGNYVYVTNCSGKLFIIKIDHDDIDNSCVINDIGITNNGCAVATDGNYVYITSGDLLYPFDITDPELPKLIQKLEIGKSHEIAAANGYAYITNSFNYRGDPTSYQTGGKLCVFEAKMNDIEKFSKIMFEYILSKKMEVRPEPTDTDKGSQTRNSTCTLEEESDSK